MGQVIALRGEASVVDVSAVHENKWNPNKQTETEYRATIEALQKHGQVLPLCVRNHPDKTGEYEVIDGAHRIRAFREVGAAKVSIHNLGDVSDRRAKHLNAVLTETRGSADAIELAYLYRDLSNDMEPDELVVGLPYSTDEMDQLISLTDYDWREKVAGAEKPDFGADDTGTVKFGPYHVQADAAPLVKQAMETLGREEGFSPHKAFEMICVEWLQTRQPQEV